MKVGVTSEEHQDDAIAIADENSNVNYAQALTSAEENRLDTGETSAEESNCKSFKQNVPVSKVEESGWQSTKTSLQERNAVMLNNELMADVHFIVGPEGYSRRIPAHKYVLATGSSVFYAMFYGGLANDKVVEIPDVDPTAFVAMLRYLYTDDIDLEADTVLATLYAAKKYLLPYLARACVNFLETSLNARNACLLLSQSRLFEEPELMERCWQVIDAQAELALKSDGFPEIDFHTLESVLSRETLNAKEISIFEAVVRWAEAECTRHGLQLLPENKRNVLRHVFNTIRIPAMSLTEFADKVVSSELLTLPETRDIFLYFTATVKPSVNFPALPRRGLTPHWCRRFQSCAYRSNQWRYRGRCDSIQFSVDRRIFIAGLGLYGSSTGTASYRVKMELKQAGTILAANDTVTFCDGSSNPIPVYLTDPVQIEPDKFYTVSVLLDGQELSYFGQEGQSEVSTPYGVTFQFQCSSESTNGTGVQGGQIPEIMFYV